MTYQKETKAIKLLQDKAKDVDSSHQEIKSDLDEIKALLQAQLSELDKISQEEIQLEKEKIFESMSVEIPLKPVPIEEIYAEAQSKYRNNIMLRDILSIEDFAKAQERYNHYIQDFNKRYALDAWDYAIAGSCGLFAGMLDIFFVQAPPKPTVSYSQKVDGVFNQWVQSAFNILIPPDLSKMLSLGNNIGSADTSSSNKFFSG